MIEETSAMDRPVARPGGGRRRAILAVGIVAAHGGALRIAAREGGGTAVSFGLPAVYS